MNIFYIIAFLLGTGFGWCLCSLVDILRRYLDMKRHQKKSERTWAELRPYLEHAMDRNADGGLVWLSYNELRERKKKQNEQMVKDTITERKKQNELHDKQARRNTKETSGTP